SVHQLDIERFVSGIVQYNWLAKPYKPPGRHRSEHKRKRQPGKGECYGKNWHFDQLSHGLPVAKVRISLFGADSHYRNNWSLRGDRQFHKSWVKVAQLVALQPAFGHSTFCFRINADNLTIIKKSKCIPERCFHCPQLGKHLPYRSYFLEPGKNQVAQPAR